MTEYAEVEAALDARGFTRMVFDLRPDRGRCWTCWAARSGRTRRST